jgi:hypothetical protein
MKVILSKSQWFNIGKKAGFIKEARRKDSLGKPLAYMDKYVLKKKVHGMDDPYFFSNGSLHAPELVMDFKDALQIAGDKLEDMAWDWTRDWSAIPVKRQSDELQRKLILDTPSTEPTEPTEAKETVKVTKVATQIPNTQNQNSDSSDFAVDLASKHKAIKPMIKSMINKEIHALGNYFNQIPLEQIFAIFKKYDVVMLQEDGTKWSGFVTTQGDCGSEKAYKNGPMTFELAVKTESGYLPSTNALIMTACTMPSGRIEIVAYIS